VSAECGMKAKEHMKSVGCTTRTARLNGHDFGFTMIEIAISLAVIGFALVAIIGILPTGMSAQKENRHETIIAQDASVLLEGIRNGARGMDDLTNYVLAITNTIQQFQPRGAPVGGPVAWFYTRTNANAPTGTRDFWLTNGARIVGLLSTPKFVTNTVAGGFFSNHVIAIVRSMSGPAIEKTPQTNSIMQDLGLAYRLVADVSPVSTNYFDPTWIDANRFPTNSLEYTNTINYSNVVRNLQTNLHDLRLTFRWPLLPNGSDTGPFRQAFRVLVGGAIATDTNAIPGSPTNLYFFQPRVYVRARPT